MKMGQLVEILSKLPQDEQVMLVAFSNVVLIYKLRKGGKGFDLHDIVNVSNDDDFTPPPIVRR